MVDMYSDVFDRVDVYGFGDGDFGRENVRVVAFPEPRSRPINAARHPAFAARWRSAALASTVAREVGDDDFVHVDFPQMMVNVPRSLKVDVLDFHNLEHQRMHAQISSWHGVRRVLAELEVARLKRFEFRSALAATLTTACSTSDAAALSAAGANVMHAPNGVWGVPNEFVPAPGHGRVLFIGSMDYYPNSEGLRWLTAEVWPKVRELNPTAELVVAGRNAGASVEGLDLGPRVTVVDSPPSIANLYLDADVCIVPLLSGAGTKIKLLEAMCFGRTAVSTSIGLEGLTGLEAYVRRADTAHGFAVAITEQLSSATSSTRGFDAFQYGQQNLTWGAALAPLARRLGPLSEGACPVP